MAEDTAPVVAHIGAGAMVLNGVNTPLSATPLPILYFDNALSLSHLNGVIGVTLVVTGNVPTTDGRVIECASVAAHLKCNIPAAMALRGALDNALALAQKAMSAGKQ
jgi:hypothetical protein